ncbi:MAG TPA: hypothetical protein VGP72_04995 [Planctomycetota bacterium]|jgi:hypothetical protein
MKLRHLLLLTSAIGACGALLLAADMYRRLKDAEAAVGLPVGAAKEDFSVLGFGLPHTFGLVSLAFMFLAMLLLMISAFREKAATASPAPVVQVPQPVGTVQTLHELAERELELQPSVQFEPTIIPASPAAEAADASAPGALPKIAVPEQKPEEKPEAPFSAKENDGPVR